MAERDPSQEAEATISHKELPLTLSQIPKGQPSLWKVEYSGLEYPGEVIVTDRWQDELGAPLADDLHFRVVLFTQPQTVSPQWLVDPRVVLWLPTGAETGSPVPATLRESAATYQVVAEEKEPPASASLFTPWGSIVSKSPLNISPDALLAVGDDEGRLKRLLAALMEATVGVPPIAKAALPKPITPEDAEEVFQGLFHTPALPQALQALDSFAPALGLARPDNPRFFDPSECRVFEILRERLALWRGDWPIKRLYQELSQSCGLPWYLITLYLLSFLYHADPPVELLLRRGHRLALSKGGKPREDTLKASDVPRLIWQPGFEEALDRLRHMPSPPWDAVLPLAIHISGELKPAADPGEVERQKILLVTQLQGLKEGLGEVKASLQQLATGLGEPVGDEIRAALKRLSRLAERMDYLQFYAVAQREYEAPEGLGKDVALFSRLYQLQNFIGEVIAAKAYLERAVLKEQNSELALDRLTILPQIGLANLTANPHLWPSLRNAFQWFKTHYVAACRAYHTRYQKWMANLRAALERAGLSLGALQYLNSLEKLGPPLGLELESQYNALLTIVAPCPLGEEGGSFEEQPTCPVCGLSLTWEPPEEGVARFLAALEDALRQKHRQLSSEAVHMILAQSRDPRMDQFIKIIQASGLSSLENVLNDEVMAFLQKLLGEEVIYTPPRSIFKELQDRLGTLSEEEIEVAGRELTALLREALAQAKRENPGKKVRINPV